MRSQKLSITSTVWKLTLRDCLLSSNLTQKSTLTGTATTGQDAQCRTKCPKTTQESAPCGLKSQKRISGGRSVPLRCYHTVGHSGLQTAAAPLPEGDTLGQRAEMDVREVLRGLDMWGNYSDASSVQ